MDLAKPLPQITQLKRRSQSLREWRKASLDALNETSETSTLVRSAGVVSKARQHTPG